MNNLMDPKERVSSFESVTEMPGTGATSEALSMLATRYLYAGKLAEGKEVIEIAHGPGMGLGHLHKVAKSVSCGDYDPDMVALVNKQYAGRVTSQRLDAMDLPYDAGSFDVVLILEALYFVPEPHKAISEALRVLRPGGKLMIAQPNPEFSSFNPAPSTFKYFTASEFWALNTGARCEILAGFPEARKGLKSKIFSAIRSFAVKFNLIPKTMGGKELIKKLMHGKLEPFPAEVDPAAIPTETYVPLAEARPLTRYKVLYATFTK